MKAFDIWKQSSEEYLSRVGKSGDEAKAALGEFLRELEPDFNEATLSADPNAINFLRDRIAGRAARIANNAVAANSEAIAALAAGVLRTAIFVAAV